MTEVEKINNDITFRTEGLTKDYVTGETVVQALRGVTMEILKGDNVTDGIRVVPRD